MPGKSLVLKAKKDVAVVRQNIPSSKTCEIVSFENVANHVSKFVIFLY